MTRGRGNDNSSNPFFVVIRHPNDKTMDAIIPNGSIERGSTMLPVEDGWEYKVDVIIQEAGWAQRLGARGWFYVVLYIDGERAASRYLEQPHYQGQRAEWTFEHFKNGKAFKFNLRNDGDVPFEEQQHSSCGTIRVEFIPAEPKYRHEMENDNYQLYRKFQQSGPTKVAPRVDMHGGWKQKNSLLRTAEGRSIRPDRGSSRRPSTTCPAKTISAHHVGELLMKYDTPGNLEFRGILDPVKVKKHRVFFTGRDFLAEARKRSRNEEMHNQSKEVVMCDLLDSDDDQPMFSRRKKKNVLPRYRFKAHLEAETPIENSRAIMASGSRAIVPKSRPSPPIGVDGRAEGEEDTTVPSSSSSRAKGKKNKRDSDTDDSTRPRRVRRTEKGSIMATW